MKVAILGHNPVGLELALFFDQIGASVVWMGTNLDLDRYDSFYRQGLDLSLLTGEHGLLRLGKNQSFDSFEDYFRKYFKPLAETLKQTQDIKLVDIESVNKRFLRTEEEIKGRSRFLDLFRIRYSMDPKEFVEAQKNNNPEVYERMTAEIIQSLQTKVEMYEDVDLVINALERLTPRSLGTNGDALGEKRIQSEKLVYGDQALASIAKLQEDDEIREVIIVGSGEQAALGLVELHPWLVKVPSARIFVVSAEEDPFTALKDSSPALYEKVHAVLFQQEAEYKDESDEFLSKLREWQELEDYIKAKKPRPAEPIPRLVFFSGHSVTAVDQLIDKKRLFLTLEKPDFREGHKQPDNNVIELKTIGADKILVLSGSQKKSVSSSLRVDEKGYFDIEMPSIWDQHRKTKLKKIVDEIEYEISRLFSPSSPH